jgi:hypothetical protein
MFRRCGKMGLTPHCWAVLNGVTDGTPKCWKVLRRKEGQSKLYIITGLNWISPDGLLKNYV